MSVLELLSNVNPGVFTSFTGTSVKQVFLEKHNLVSEPVCSCPGSVDAVINGQKPS